MLIRVLSIIVLTLGLGVLALFWMVTVPKKLGIPVYFKTGGFWRVLVGTLIVGLSVLSSTRFPFPPQQFDIFIILTGITLYITGSLLAIAAKLTMSDRWGMPASHNPQRQNKLFTNTPFAIFRNSTFTVSIGTAILLILAENYSPVFLGIIAGLGAVAGDLTIFQFVHSRGFVEEVKHLFEFFGSDKIHHLLHTKYFSWTLPVVGALIIASPLPDELGVSLMGISRMKPYQFILLSFGLNSLGIFLILTASNF